MTGHLATIISLQENNFIATNFATRIGVQGAWLGGRAPADDGGWRWVVGPEADTQFALGRDPTAPYDFANWGGNETNHAQGYVLEQTGALESPPTAATWSEVAGPYKNDGIVNFMTVPATTESIFFRLRKP